MVFVRDVEKKISLFCTKIVLWIINQVSFSARFSPWLIILYGYITGIYIFLTFRVILNLNPRRWAKKKQQHRVKFYPKDHKSRKRNLRNNLGNEIWVNGKLHGMKCKGGYNTTCEFYITYFIQKVIESTYLRRF